MTKTPLRAILARANTDATPNEALRPKPAQSDTTRRALFGFVGLAGVAVAMPAVVIASMQPTPSLAVAKYRAALARFNAIPGNLEETDEPAWEREEDVYLTAYDEFRNYTPASLPELAEWVEAVSAGEPWSNKTVQIIRDLAAKEGR